MLMSQKMTIRTKKNWAKLMTHVRLWSFSDYWGGLAPLLQGDFFWPQGEGGGCGSDSIVPGLNSQASEVLGTGGPLCTHDRTHWKDIRLRRGGGKEEETKRAGSLWLECSNLTLWVLFIENKQSVTESFIPTCGEKLLQHVAVIWLLS